MSEKSSWDLGCGEFNVGRRLAKTANGYIGCDIARPLIEHNKRKSDWHRHNSILDPRQLDPSRNANLHAGRPTCVLVRR
jgi:hypothetical protein